MVTRTCGLCYDERTISRHFFGVHSTRVTRTAVWFLARVALLTARTAVWFLTRVPPVTVGTLLCFFLRRLLARVAYSLHLVRLVLRDISSGVKTPKQAVVIRSEGGNVLWWGSMLIETRNGGNVF